LLRVGSEISRLFSGASQLPTRSENNLLIFFMGRKPSYLRISRSLSVSIGSGLLIMTTEVKVKLGVFC